MRKRKDKRKRRRSRNPASAAIVPLSHESSHLRLRAISFTVLYEPIEEPSVPPELDPQIIELYHLAQDHPAQALPRIEALLQQYPNARPLHNYLQVAHSYLGNRAKVAQLVEEDFHNLPDYLFARVAYGEMLVRQKRFDEFDRVFPDGVDPKILYPHRNKFHVTEVLAVYTLAAYNCIKRGQLDAASDYLDILREVDEDSRQVKMIEGELSVATLKQRVKKFFGLGWAKPNP